MEFDFWWLPGAALFFALGWLASRRESGQSAPPENNVESLPQAYFRGLNFVLKEDPQKAIDAFTELIRQEPDLVELHFALGQLFRRRGETDRAIRVHQNLLQRTLLSASDRDRARYEIAQDYFKAGLYDRADAALGQLEDSTHAPEAFALRLDIAQRLKDWSKALGLLANDHADYAEVGSAQQDPSRLALQAHLHCELALEHQARSDDRAALAAFATATSVAPNHPRAYLALGALHARLGQSPQAIDLGRGILARWPAFACTMAEWWLGCHARGAAGPFPTGPGEAEPTDALGLLIEAQQRAPSAELLSLILRAVEARDGAEAALELAEREALRAPNASNLLELLERRAQSASSADRLEAVRSFLQRLGPASGRLSCNRCGFQSTRHVWQCPGCSRWDTYSPIPADATRP
ncbi:MAG: tetratricopeptide repeat protein [Betaproteobacteria bacterium]|nr:tetratricopeptide repeat protein [Betaproteobacteria bacterium]